MTSIIQAIRPEVNRNFPIPGFRIRSDRELTWGEVAVATAPEFLFEPNAKAQRTESNFYSSRATGPFPIERGEAIYLLPPQVMARFAGQQRLYYALATYPNRDWRSPSVVRLPAGAVPYISISRSYTGEIHGILGLGNNRRRDGYYGMNTNGRALEWGGDMATAGEVVPIAAPANGARNGNGSTSGGNGGGMAPVNGSASTPAVSQAMEYDYDDGFSTSLWRQPRSVAPPTARALRIVRPDYMPSNPQEAIALMREFITRYDRWRAGVPDTTYFPHSAICKFEMTFPDGTYVGTGFYVGPDRILTCAHNVIDWGTRNEASQIVITPGRNGSNRPFPSFTVRRSDWDYHPAYDGGFDHDLAVIRVSTPPPSGQFFELEDLAATPNSAVIVCGYAAETGDVNQQKLDGDTIRGVSDNLERIQYNLQTEPGNSGSPVFYAGAYEDDVRQQSVAFFSCIGVHVSGHSETLNQACRLTQAKINWIYNAGAPASFAMGASHHARQHAGGQPAQSVPRQLSSEAPMQPANHRMEQDMNRPRMARAQGIVRPDYMPSNPQDAIATMRDFVNRYDRWRAGVPNTTYFPHSAICKFNITFPSGSGGGTGFYIANDRILTCAHNVIDWATREEATQITVTPGMNDNNHPFPAFTVRRSDWDFHPSYDGTRDYDLAVIRVSTPPPGGQFFEVEDLAATPNSPVIVCGYSVETGDENRQKLDADTIRDVSSNMHVIYYNLQTLPGASGSPVFYVGGYEDEARQQSVSFVRCIGVHVARVAPGQPGADTLNRGCRLTEEKIGWIFGNTMPFALGHRQESMGHNKSAYTRNSSNGNAHNGQMHNGASQRGGAAPHTATLTRPPSSAMALRTAQALNFEPFAADDVERMKQELQARAAAANPTCIGVTNAALRSLYGSLLQNADGSSIRLGSSIQDTMGVLQGRGLAQAPTIMEFNETSGRMTRGVARPDHLRVSVENWLLNMANATAMSAWYVFGLSLMDGYHSVLLAMQFSGSGNPATHIYWCDQIYGGWDEVTGQLDARITRLIQGWWDGQPQNRKARTRVTVWPLNASVTTMLPTTQGSRARAFAEVLIDEMDGVEGAEEEPQNAARSFDANCIDNCTDSFCPVNNATTAGTAHFSLDEFRCNDGTEVPERFRGNVQRVMENLEVLRSELGNNPITIRSGYRTCSYNCTLRGAASRSRHLCGQAADIVVQGYTPSEIHATIERLIAGGRMVEGGLGLYRSFVHYDIRGNRSRWTG